MSLIALLIIGAFVISVVDALFVLPSTEPVYCAQCGTRTHRRGILLSSCSNSEHQAICDRLYGGDE
jgi:hypothetical protein